VARQALQSLEHYLRHGSQDDFDVFLKHVNWLEQNAVFREDGAVVWPHYFDLQEGALSLKSPWISANVQGLAISALVRAWRITGEKRFVELLPGTSRVFELDHRGGGVRIDAAGHTIYTEFPGLAPPGVMDGFLASLLGLWDLFVETGDEAVRTLFMDGMRGLRYFLPRWDYRKKWSMYSNRVYLSPPGYHCQNRLMLQVLGTLTGDSWLQSCASAWDPERLSFLDRLEIYSAFLLTKNWCRIKFKVWNDHKGPPPSQVHSVRAAAGLEDGSSAKSCRTGTPAK
jgi:hypothetical protein